MSERDVSAVRVEPTGGAIGAGSDVTQHSVGELIKEVTQDLTKLFNQELALAKLEMSNEAKKAGKTAGAYAGAGAAGYFLVLFASLTLMFALASLFDSFTWAALVVTVLWAVAGAVLYSKAKKTAAQLNPKPEMTVQTLEEDVQWAKTPEQLRAEIARTRAELGEDLDVLVEKVTPSKVVERKVDATKEKVVGVKDRIMGSASSARESVSTSTGSATGSAAGSVGSAGHAVADAASQAPAAVRQRTSGNPLAAGVVAFGLGWLASSLLPASKLEQQGADRLKEAAQSVAEPVKEGLASAAGEVKDNLAPAAQEAAQAVKQEATDAASTVKDEAGRAQSQVQDQATGSAQTVKETASGAAQDAKEQATRAEGSGTPPLTADQPTVAIVVEEEDVDPAPFPPDPSGSTSDYTSGRVPPRPTI